MDFSGLGSINQDLGEAVGAKPGDQGWAALNMVLDPAGIGGTYAGARNPLDPYAAAMQKAQARQDQVYQQLQAYIAELQKPLDPDDPMVKQVLNDVQGRVAEVAGQSNTGGGLAGAAMSQGMAKAMASMELQRQGMLGNALGMGGQQSQQLLANSTTQYFNQLASLGSQKGQLLSLAGGAVGGYFGGPSGAAAGSKIGGGLGYSSAMSTGSQAMQNYPTSPPPSAPPGS